jgi:CRP-like cAMP-binding protein
LDRAGGLDFRRHFVLRAPLFRGLPAEACAELVRLARERRVVRRESFYLQDEPADDVHVLCAGRLKMTQVSCEGEQAILRLTGPGEAFGALEALGGGQYSTGAEALEASHALVWDGQALAEMGERHPVLLRNMLRITAERTRALERRWRELATERVPLRVANTLLQLLGQVGRPVDEGTLVGLSRDELAQMTGTTLFTVSRLLGEWQAHGLVIPRREAVVVTDAVGLAALLTGSATRVRAGGDELHSAL